jgi:hypothetical protein
MFKKINEPIEVQVKFFRTQVFPSFFKWRDKTYRVEKVDLIHHQQEGIKNIYHFGVSNKTNFFRIAFFVNDLSWKIESLQ